MPQTQTTDTALLAPRVRTAQHTPGPWIVFGGGLAKVSARNIFTAEIGSVEGGPRLALVTGHVTRTELPDWEDFDSRTVEANARLIAAAPELLAACEAVFANLSPLYSEEHHCMKLLRAAIAKATTHLTV